MINVTRERKTAHTIADLWQLLSDPTNLPRVLDRIKKVEVGTPNEHTIPITAYFDFGAVFGLKAADGIFTANDQHEVMFEAQKPLPILARWTLKPHAQGTLISALLRFDLKPLAGPLARMAPVVMIRKEVSDELDEALKRVDALCSQRTKAST